ncbi:uncharacterized protein LOC114148656 isoform X1 [Xiphophorus couchianus]|uniref:uncharacterized protein LOC114148656 isoform X1 n=1 Tax=Xiphophorus couchianus TaxID=32473 RepID=UPI0010170F0F|nr:uncharacterized protein LOC114148656 isoform X1 [Xiphophorus couchianus]
MTALVAALKVEVQHLEKDNEGKTTDLQSLNQRYQVQETLVQKLQDQNQVQETQVKTLQDQIQAVAAELAGIRANAENQGDNLKRDGEVKMMELQSLNQRYQAQEFQVKDLQEQIQAQAAELAAVKVNTENQVEALKRDGQVQAAELAAVKLNTENQVEALKREGEAQAAELAAVKVKANMTGNQVEALKIQGEAHAAELAAIKATISENHVETVKRNGEVKRLAFSVSLLASDYRTIGPFNTDITLIFKRVVTNIGNAYNPDTGLFTAPVRGVYHFEFHIYGHGSPNPTSAVLVKNGEQICTSYTSQPTGAQKASNGVSLLLEIGNVVYLRMWANSWVHDNQNRHTTFSGHLLFTM